MPKYSATRRHREGDADRDQHRRVAVAQRRDALADAEHDQVRPGHRGRVLQQQQRDRPRRAGAGAGAAATRSSARLDARSRIVAFSSGASAAVRSASASGGDPAPLVDIDAHAPSRAPRPSACHRRRRPRPTAHRGRPARWPAGASGCRPPRSRRPAAARPGRRGRPCSAGAPPGSPWCRAAPGPAPPRPAPRCARPAPRAGRRAPAAAGLPSTARASASRWRWPPDSDSPCSPTRVVSPHGRSCTKSAWATASASAISSSVASGRPRVRFSRTLIENSVASSKATPTTERSESRVTSRMSRPSSVIRPAVTSIRRGTSETSVVLPEPVAPTMASVSPGLRPRGRPRAGSGSAAPGVGEPYALEPHASPYLVRGRASPRPAGPRWTARCRAPRRSGRPRSSPPGALAMM